jgi:hypothetical protein
MRCIRKFSGHATYTCQKSQKNSCRMGRRIVVMKLIYSLGHCKCDGHTTRKLSHRRLTTNWLAPRESDCSRMQTKVSSDWLSSYIKDNQPVLEIFKMAGYFPDNSCKVKSAWVHNSTDSIRLRGGPINTKATLLTTCTYLYTECPRRKNLTSGECSLGQTIPI